MKKALIALVVLALVAWIISWFRAPQAVKTSAARPWPAGLGSLESVERSPATQTNAAASALVARARTLPKEGPANEYVMREVARGDLMIGKPPALPDVAAMRDLLLRERLVWARHDEVGDAEAIELRGHVMTAARALVASALAKASTGDVTSWDDLHAVWALAKSFDGDTQMMSQTAVLSMSRTINAVAWKMPLPAPAWLSELQTRDHVRPLLVAFQHQSASYWQDGARLFPTKWLATSVDHDRAIAEELARETRCDVNARANDLGVDLTSVWRRAFRYRAEREATANALRLREGRAIEPKSACSDGSWIAEAGTLRFSREIPVSTSERPMPLTLHVQAR